MTNAEGMLNYEALINRHDHPSLSFELRHSFVIRHSSFNVALCSFRRIGFGGRWRAGIVATARISPGAPRATHNPSLSPNSFSTKPTQPRRFLLIISVSAAFL